ncbi:MAG TPA: glycosyltransferase family 2 protein [Solirubrobacteraceae bacterium]|nr:glycosyltransferase family 2 protein [Solirubrobacteraceae bacterium]
MSAAPLAVVPIYLRTAEDLDVLLRCLVSLVQTAPQADVLVVDDCSPVRELVDLLATTAGEVGFELVRRPVNGGFATTVNVGLRRALQEGRDAVLVNADIEFHAPAWLDAMLARSGTDGTPAAVVGARLLYPNGLLQHAGIYFSLLHRGFAHRFNLGPGDLPEALVPCRCPVTGALQLIRHDCLGAVGLYDEAFHMGWEDVDYCLRVFAAGHDVVYEPAACATHAESLFRSRTAKGQEDWERRSLAVLLAKHGGADLSAFVPAYS